MMRLLPLVIFFSFALGLPAPSLSDTQAQALIQVQSLLDQAKRDQAAGNLADSEQDYLRALTISKTLPPKSYHVQSDLLRDLGAIYFKEGKTSDAENLCKERLDLLLSHRNGLDLDVGDAMFNLESIYELTGRDHDGAEMYGRVVEFYKSCQADAKQRADMQMAATCEGRLANAEGIRALGLFNQHRSADAEPLLQSVVSRSDTQVDAGVLETSLLALTTISSKRGNLDEAKTLARRAWQLRSKYTEAQSVEWPKAFTSFLQP